MANRTKSRNKTILSPYGVTRLYSKTGSLTGTYPFAAGSADDQYQLREFITYERGPQTSKTKNCTHHSRITTMFPVSCTRYAITDNYAVDTTVTDGNWSVSSVSLPYDGWDSGFNARAFSAMLPDLEASMNLGQFLAELSDITRLKGLVTKWRGFTKKIAEGHLSYAFGVKPFISDVKSLYHTLANHQAILEDFFNRRGKVQKRYYSEAKLTDSGTSGVTTYNAHTKYFHTWRDAIEYHATMTYTYDCPNIDSYWDFIKAMRQMLGLRLTQSLVWELIPFSFVVDWFFRVGDYLERFEESLWPVTVTVIDYSISRKRTCSVTHFRKALSSTSDTSWYDTVVRKQVLSSYERRRAIPDSESTFINRGQYGLNQLALSASLLRVLR